MPEQYSQDQLWKLYESLPEDLQEAIFSGENADLLDQICTRNGVDNLTQEIARYGGQVLMGILPLESLQKTFEHELKMPPEMAKQVVHEINRFIFFPVKQSLEKLYAPVGSASASATGSLAEKSETPPEPPAPKAPDAYRESIE